MATSIYIYVPCGWLLLLLFPFSVSPVWLLHGLFGLQAQNIHAPFLFVYTLTEEMNKWIDDDKL